MAQEYKIVDSNTVMHVPSGKGIPLSASNNSDLSEYLAWVTQGNIPDLTLTPEQVKANAAKLIVSNAKAAIESILTLDERIDALATAVEFLEDKGNGKPTDPMLELKLKEDRAAIKAIRDQAKLDVLALG
jgi:hypothetical protein